MLILRMAGVLPLVLCLSSAARAEDMASFKVEMKDGTISPPRLTVPAGKPFRLEIANTGKSSAELESTELHREKVLPPEGSSSLVFRRLTQGEYKFFDDFHPDGPGMVLVVE